MAFGEKDTSAQVTGTAKVDRISFCRDEDLPGAPLVVLVEREVNGIRQVGRVPAATVDAGWPGNAKTLKAHLFQIIDLAEFPPQP